ncbi:Uncharacterised protein [Delftia tsuruhatensis]|uniref:hypothetical protein n=1 Tax=Delftia tsuruhatensis TaxID=180282 RepID=UPI001E6C4792|nr:hypothetical protein [Delftia tsuruhatensis]CAB5721789.1 Uncharacterised protein [Delftia tsuruhatensis]CAC9680479.1 Uncharacterised protein [Delftia tsuruhatensis]
MDNFAWVNELADRLEEQGQQRLAHLIHDVPYQKYLGNHALVEALTPEALAAARSLEIPWLEVYFKHWLCASRIARHQGEQLLGEVVEAYEGAHQDKTQGCPQSVCVTQDLVGTYANVDGPGWARERLAACDETLSRIDTSWNCFGCLTIERANAMGDLGQRREALAYLRSQRDAQARDGEEPGTLYVTTEVEQWLSLGDAHKALALLDETQEDSDQDDPEEQSTRLLQRCRALAMTGQAQAAWEQLPDFADIEVAAYVHWARAAVAAAGALPELNTPALGHALWVVTEHLHAAGSHRLLIELALAQSGLALARQVPWLAEQALARALEHVPQLREDLGAGASVQQARQVLASASAPALPCAAQELAQWLGSDAADGLASETVIQWLEQVHGQWPQDQAIAMRLAGALAGFGLGALARSRVQAMVQAAPDSVELQNHWFSLCFDADDLAAIEEQARRIEPHLPAMAAWYRAKVAYREGRHAQVGPLIEQVLRHDPEAAPTRRLWADAAMQLKDFDTAVQQRRLVLQSEPEPEPGRRWELLIAATAAGQWAEVRSQARALGMELEECADEDSVVEEDWGLIYLRIGEEGRTRDVLARRTGPATARIVQPSPRGFAQRVGDWVVFPPQLAEQPPEDEQELEHYLRVFVEPLHVLEGGGHGPSYMIDGQHPGEELLTAWRDQLEEDGWKTWQYSNDSYRITDPQAGDGGDEDEDDGDGEGGLPGLYLAVSAPAHVPAQQIERRIAALCHGHPLCWLELARAAGQPTEWHEAMQERYGL